MNAKAVYQTFGIVNLIFAIAYGFGEFKPYETPLLAWVIWLSVSTALVVSGFIWEDKKE